MKLELVPLIINSEYDFDFLMASFGEAENFAGKQVYIYFLNKYLYLCVLCLIMMNVAAI
jgi:hypothetical protein